MTESRQTKTMNENGRPAINVYVQWMYKLKRATSMLVTDLDEHRNGVINFQKLSST